MKKIVCFLVCMSLFSFSVTATYQEEEKIEEKQTLSIPRVFIQEMVMELVNEIMDDNRPVTLSMKYYRELLRSEIEKHKHYENACIFADYSRCADNVLEKINFDLFQAQRELERKDFVIVKSIDELVRLEKKMSDICAEQLINRLKFHEEFSKKQNPEHKELADKAQLQASMYNTEDKILLLKQVKEREYYEKFDAIIFEK